MVDHDRLFKELLTTFLDDFLRLFAPALSEALVADSVEILNTELGTDIPQAGKRVVDVLARLRFRDAPDEAPSCVLVHVENQSTAEPGFPERMFRYFAAIVLKFGHTPVYPIAVFSYAEPSRPEPTEHVVRLPGLEVLRFQFMAVQLNRLPWRDFLEKPNPVAAALMARMQIEPGERPRVKAACLRMLVGLGLDPARQERIAVFVDTYLRLDDQEETIFRTEIASTPEEEKIMEYTTSWMEKGIAQGREEGHEKGLEKGREEGQRAAFHILKILVGERLGPLSPATEKRLAAMPTATLERLGEDVLGMRTAADLETWLTSHS